MPEIKVKVTCPHCGKVSTNPPLASISIGDDEQMYAVTCPECGKSFRVDKITSDHDRGIQS